MCFLHAFTHWARQDGFKVDSGMQVELHCLYNFNMASTLISPGQPVHVN